VVADKSAASQDGNLAAQPMLQQTQAPQPATVPMPNGLTQTNALISATPAQVVDVISDSLTSPEDRKNRIVVQLDPPELGRVSIDYKFDSHGLQHVTITGESPEAMRQLRLMHFELVNALEKQGLSSQNMSFQQQQAQQDPSQQAPRTNRLEADMTGNRELTVPALIASQISQPGSTSSGGLNIKL
jgi:flagellar hook-length control protein FliK